MLSGLVLYPGYVQFNAMILWDYLHSFVDVFILTDYVPIWTKQALSG